MKLAGFKIRECLIWVKNCMVMGRQDYQWRHEPILYTWKEGAGHNWYSDRKQTTILEFNKPSKSLQHPTTKPVDLWEYLMQNSSKPGDIVLDQFMGSGTTIIAAERLGRHGYGLELDERYAQAILDRYQKFSGKKAVREDGVTLDELLSRPDPTDMAQL
jgi:site-specific DNA-methyltransferase (adenine-specific)